jgi:hypothetical protein
MADRLRLEVKHELAKRVSIADIDRMKVGIGWEVFRPARAQVVDDQDLVARFERGLCNMAADEARASGH